MVVEVKHKNIVEIGQLSAGDCFIYENTFYMLLERNNACIKQVEAFPCTSVMLETGEINQIAAWAEVVKVNAKVIVE